VGFGSFVDNHQKANLKARTGRGHDFTLKIAADLRYASTSFERNQSHGGRPYPCCGR
jgi:hypothetical protein